MDAAQAGAPRRRASAHGPAALLEREPDLGLVVMGHTHQAARWTSRPAGSTSTPGAWFDGFRYAVATETSAELRHFSPAAPPPPVPAAPR